MKAAIALFSLDESMSCDDRKWTRATAIMDVGELLSFKVQRSLPFLLFPLWYVLEKKVVDKRPKTEGFFSSI